jgi:hypothetical protein
MSSRNHQETIRQNLQNILNLLKDREALIADPKQVDLQLIFEISIQEQRVTTLDEMFPENYLTALDNTEKWFKDHGLEYPQPARLVEQREYWQKRLNEMPKSR